MSARAYVRRRAGGCCEICGSKFRCKQNRVLASMHHRYMRRFGGIDAVQNLLYLCSDCHAGVHAHPAAESEHYAGLQGWIAWADPALTPLRLHHTRWVLLTPDGRYEDVPPDEAEEILTWLATFAPAATSVA